MSVHSPSLRETIADSLAKCERNEPRVAQPIAAFGMTPRRVAQLREMIDSQVSHSRPRVLIVDLRHEYAAKRDRDTVYWGYYSLDPDLPINGPLLSTPRSEYVVVHDSHDYADKRVPSDYVLKVLQRCIECSRWCLACFEGGKKYWLKEASAELQEYVKSTFSTFDSSGGLSPIGNRLKDALEKSGIGFQTQRSIYVGQKHYKIDFYVEENRRTLAVECDGLDYHSGDLAEARDSQRDMDLQTIGIQTLRLAGGQIWLAPDECIRKIKRKLGLDSK